MKQERSINGEQALSQGRWVKLICGASNQDLPSIADLCAIYATAGVHCIDVAADGAVVLAAREALDWVESKYGKRPWLMISISDGKDAHFRKAWFDPDRCPSNCSRPCQNICPAKAIGKEGGINSKSCYGCGRCLMACPLGLIKEEDRSIGMKDFSTLLTDLKPDAVEIHTAPGRAKAFEQSVSEIMKANIPLQRIAVSCGLQGYGIDVEEFANELWQRHSSIRNFGQKPIWQLDGRRMSGDLGINAAKFAVKLWKRVLPLAPPGPLQLAGGTNSETINHLPMQNGPAGVAFGGMARKLIQPWLLEAQAQQISLKEWPEGWEAALKEAKKLISPWLNRSLTIKGENNRDVYKQLCN